MYGDVKGGSPGAGGDMVISRVARLSRRLLGGFPPFRWDLFYVVSGLFLLPPLFLKIIILIECI